MVPPSPPPEAARLRLVAYTDAGTYAGAEISLGNLIEELASWVEVHVVGRDERVTRSVAARRPGTSWSVVPAAATGGGLADVHRHVRALRRLRADVVHVNLRGPDACASAMAAVVLTRTPAVAVEHLPYPFGGRARRWWTRLLSRRLVVIATSRTSARETEIFVGLPMGSVASIFNGVPAVVGRRGAEPGRTIGVLARLVPEKRIDLLLRALPSIPDARAVIVGDGPDRPRLEGIASGLGVRDRVRFVSWREKPFEVAPFDVLVQPSELESFPLVLLEAMHAGIPVVAARAGGVAEMIEHGVTGLLVPRGDSDALGSAISELLDDRRRAAELAERARHVARSRFTPRRMARAYEAAYSSIVAGELRRARGLRLLVYTDATSWGGAEEVVGSILQGLSPETEAIVVGVDRRVVDLVAARRPGTATLCVPHVRHGRDIVRLAKLARTIRRLRPDLVHVNMRAPYLSMHGEIAALLARRPVVSLEHSLLPSPSIWRSLAKPITSRRLRAHVTVCAAAARWLEHDTRRPAGSIRWIYNGIWPRVVEPVRHATGTTIGSVGRIEREKGYDVLVRALPSLPGVTAVLVGAGRAADELRALASSLGVDDRLVLTGWVEDALASLAGFDVFVLPSRMEAFPLTILEAMHLGVPVVATDVGGVSEGVIDGETGLLVAPDDVDALAGAIGRLLDDASLRSRMASAASARAKALFAAERMARAYEELYLAGAGLSDVIGREAAAGAPSA